MASKIGGIAFNRIVVGRKRTVKFKGIDQY
jgi:hypothetical protein